MQKGNLQTTYKMLSLSSQWPLLPRSEVLPLESLWDWPVGHGPFHMPGCFGTLASTLGVVSKRLFLRIPVWTLVARFIDFFLRSFLNWELNPSLLCLSDDVFTFHVVPVHQFGLPWRILGFRGLAFGWLHGVYLTPQLLQMFLRNGWLFLQPCISGLKPVQSFSMDNGVIMLHPILFGWPSQYPLPFLGSLPVLDFSFGRSFWWVGCQLPTLWWIPSTTVSKMDWFQLLSLGCYHMAVAPCPVAQALVLGMR